MDNMGLLFSFSEAWLLAPSELCKLHRDRSLQKHDRNEALKHKEMIYHYLPVIRKHGPVSVVLYYNNRCHTFIQESTVQ